MIFSTSHTVLMTPVRHLCRVSSSCTAKMTFSVKSKLIGPHFLKAHGQNSLPFPFLESKRFDRQSARSFRLAFSPRAAKKDSVGGESVEMDEKIKHQVALETAMAAINKQFGKGSVARLGSMTGVLETIPSGNLALDVALGGGLPKGRIVEIFGPESSGKTTLAFHAIAEVQKAGGNALLIDAEHAFDVAYAERLGINVDDLLLIQPDSGEMALEAADVLIRSRSVQIICVDSVSALVPRAELEGEIGQNQIGLQARLMSSSLRKLSGNASKAGCTVIFLNQLRYKVGVYGNPETTSGGMALKFFASVRIDVRPVLKLKAGKGDDVIGIHCRAKIVKSKVSQPSRIAEFDIIFGEGVSHLGCLVDCGEVFGSFEKKGSWYSRNGLKLGQGRDNLIQYLSSNPELAEEIEQEIRSKITNQRQKTSSFSGSRESPSSGEEELEAAGFEP